MDNRFGTLTDVAYYTTHAIAKAINIEGTRQLFPEYCSTDIYLRKAYLVYIALQDFELVFDNSPVLGKIQDQLWIDTSDFTDEELNKLYDNSILTPYVEYDDYIKRIIEEYHPDVLEIILNAIEETIETYEMYGHCSFFYPEAEQVFYIPKDYQSDYNTSN